MFEFSIAIPAHDRGENGPKWMSELLDSLERQTFQDFDVVVSDQSRNDNIMNVCKEYDFDFTYVKYQGSVPCENINVALSECTGRIIKIMFSDDVLVPLLLLMLPLVAVLVRVHLLFGQQIACQAGSLRPCLILDIQKIICFCLFSLPMFPMCFSSTRLVD